MELLKCKTCGGSLAAREPAGMLWCSRCEQPAESKRLKATPAIGKPEDPIRDLVLRIYCRVMIVLLLYVLSTGPLYWAIFEAFNTSGSSYLAKLYYPIALACQYSDTICDWFDWYVGLWVY